MKRRHVKDLPAKTESAEFGGGRRRGGYTREDIARVLCSRAGCGRQAHASWAACCDGNVLRPLCAECDVELNWRALEWMGDPDREAKIVAYANRMEAEAGRRLDVSFLVR